MAAEYVDDNQYSGDSSSVTMTKPTGTAEGDQLLAFFYLEGTGNDPTLAGWTEQGTGVDHEGGHLTCLKKTAGASEPSSYNFSFDSSGQYLTGITAYDPAGGGDITVEEIEFFEGGGSATSLEWSSGESNQLGGSAGDTLVTWGGTIYVSKSFTPEGGFTERHDSGGVHLADEEDISGANSDIQHTWSGGAESFGIGLVLRETVTVEVDQDGYRIYEDDDDPSGTPTARAAEDTIPTNVPVGEGSQVRIQLDATGDPDTNAYKATWNYDGDATTLEEDIAT